MSAAVDGDMLQFMAATLVFFGIPSAGVQDLFLDWQRNQQHGVKSTLTSDSIFVFLVLFMDAQVPAAWF